MARINSTHTHTPLSLNIWCSCSSGSSSSIQHENASSYYTTSIHTYIIFSIFVRILFYRTRAFYHVEFFICFRCMLTCFIQQQHQFRAWAQNKNEMYTNRRRDTIPTSSHTKQFSYFHSLFYIVWIHFFFVFFLLKKKTQTGISNFIQSEIQFLR